MNDYFTKLIKIKKHAVMLIAKFIQMGNWMKQKSDKRENNILG